MSAWRALASRICNSWRACLHYRLCSCRTTRLIISTVYYIYFDGNWKYWVYYINAGLLSCSSDPASRYWPITEPPCATWHFVHVRHILSFILPPLIYRIYLVSCYKKVYMENRELYTTRIRLMLKHLCRLLDICRTRATMHMLGRL